MRKTTKNLTETHPEICKLWHPTKNTLRPTDVHRTSKVKCWFKCPMGNDHEWESYVFSQVKYPGCPCCSGQKVVWSNCLANNMPDIAKQWHPTKNTLKPTEVTISSARKIWWQCEENLEHIWEARVFSRTKNKAGCPFCKNKKAGSTNSLAITHPELVREWHPIYNKGLDPNNHVEGSGVKIWWQCSKNPKHEWKVAITNRTNGGKKGKGTGCPYCCGQKTDENNCLSTLYPELAKEWHPTKNGLLLPTDVTAMSHKMIWWKCDKADDHEWEATVYNRTRGFQCPCCVGRKLVKSNCLSTTHPQIASEWHPTKNGRLTPEHVTYATNKIKVWWQCSNNSNHIWKSRIDSRTKVDGTGCPFCASSRGEKLIKEILENSNIEHKAQFRFPDCKNIRPLPFDFAIFGKGKIAGLIEFQGRQHYEAVTYFGGEEGLKYINKNDNIKLEYCKQNNIPLLLASYWDLVNLEIMTRDFLKKLVL
jgi:hypothetical protein